MAALHEGDEFSCKFALGYAERDDVFRYCNFDGLDVDGQGFEGIAVGCTFTNSSWYWSLFNTARFVEVQFRGCVFRGCGFAGCIFTLCRFVDCTFTEGKMGGDCTFDDCAWYNCTQTGCEGLPVHFVSSGKREDGGRRP